VKIEKKKAGLCADRRSLRRNTIASHDRCRPSQNLALYYNAVYQGFFFITKDLFVDTFFASDKMGNSGLILGEKIKFFRDTSVLYCNF